MSDGEPGRLRRMLAALVFAAAFAAFLPAMSQGFVVGDDEHNFVLNERWRGLHLENLRWMWSEPHFGHYSPLTWMSLALEHALHGGTRPERMHLASLLLHAANAVLAFGLIEALLLAAGSRAGPRARLAGAAAGALLWAVHPLRVESVAWLTERRDVLSTLFLLLAVRAYLRRHRGGGRGGSAAVFAWLAASLLCKAWGIVLPAVLLVLDVHPLRRHRAVSLRRLVTEKAPLWALALAFACLAFWAQRSATAFVELEEHGIAQRSAQAAWGLAFYPWKTLVPSGLSHLYLLEHGFDPLQPRFLAAAGFVGATTGILIAVRRAFPAGLAAWAASALLVSPVLGVFQSGWQIAADRYTYVWALPWSALAAGGLAAAFSMRRWRMGAAILTAAIALALGALTWRRTRLWGDSEALWREAAQVEPGNWVARHNLAIALRGTGRIDEALAEERRSVELGPARGNEAARQHLGELQLLAGDRASAHATWKDVLRTQPSRQETVEAFANDLLANGRRDEAIGLLQVALDAAPDASWARDRLARLYLEAGAATKAIEVWRGGLALDPRWLAGRAGVGVALMNLGRHAEAEPELRAALEISPSAEVHTLLGLCLLGLGRLGEAGDQAELALARDPGYARALELAERVERQGPAPIPER